MQPTFDTYYYQRAHNKLGDELMKLSFSHEEYKDKSQVISAQWADSAGRQVRQKNISPLFERYELFKQTVKGYELRSNDRCLCLFEMEKLIEEFGVSNSNIETDSEYIVNNNDECQRHGLLSDKSKDKGEEFNSARVSHLSRAKKHISPM